MHRATSTRKAAAAPSAVVLVLAAIGANVALAFGPWFVRLADTGPVAAAFWRIALAVPVLFVAASMRGEHPIARGRGLGWLIALGGVAFAADLGAWHLGIHRTTLANSTLFGNAASLIFPIYGFLVARAWPTRAQVLALLLAAAGGALLMGRSAELSASHLTGDLLCLAAGLLYAVYFIAMARVRERVPPLPALALSSLASVVPLLVFALALGERIVPDHWWPLIALAVVSQLMGQGLMIFAIGHLSPLVIGITLLVQPVVAATIGVFAYGERLGTLDLIGAVLVAVALVLVRRGSPRALAAVEAEAQKDAP